MWLTKIGSESRRELMEWLRLNCEGRVHVPIWSAHEYLKHHVAGTIVAELTTKTKDVAGVARRSYAFFRPFIDEPTGSGSEDASSIRTQTRHTLSTLDTLVSKIRRWTKSYQKHAAEVISVINALTLERTSIYDQLANIEQTGSGRFIGSVPPGYQDRRKGLGTLQPRETSDEASDGSNRYGDLVFWKEILDHAKEVNAIALVVITNDRKNDWYMGGGRVDGVGADLRALKNDWKPVPHPHPMLAMEAKLYADVQRFELLDSAYLAVLLRELAEDQVSSFADVAIIPDAPTSVYKTPIPPALQEGHRSSTAEVASTEAPEAGPIFPDAPGVSNTRGTLMRAMYESRSDIDEMSEGILQEWRSKIDDVSPLRQTIAGETLYSLNHIGLTTLARELHDRVLQQCSGYEDALTDLVSILDQLGINTAASVYLGLLSSMYLVRKSNSSRIPPSSPVAQLLFDRQSRGYALHPVDVVARRLCDNDVAPLYVPSNNCPPVEMLIETEPEVGVVDQLRSVRVGQVELLTPAQSDSSVRLITLFGGDGWADRELVVRKACELFAIPLAQVESMESSDRRYALTPTIGFKRPADISIPKERSGGE